MSDQKKKVGALFVVLVVGGGLVALASRSTNQEKADASQPQTKGSFLTNSDLSNAANTNLGSKELFAKMMFSVALVGVLAVAAFYVSRKVLPRVTNAPNKEIHVMETAYLGPRKTLHVVQVGSQKLLIGSTNETISTLAHLSDTWLNLPKQEPDSTVSL